MRSFVLTGGRARPTRNTHVLDVITMVTSVPDRSVAGLLPEQLAVVELCRGGYLSVIEVAGHLGQPLTITRVLLGDLLDTGHIVTRLPVPAVPAANSAAGQRAATAHILEKLLHGLQAL
ncbi:DUF742 domain-containing protein [Streptomyces sp. OR43]|uniref:DUF742 domain-containing protein n=1 Tax=Streptomyces sp. or43 TaxID=2478957 RepID=UPI0021C71104|nr:DUF742 domain-containing protein [Streptomyces sp. or43]